MTRAVTGFAKDHLLPQRSPLWSKFWLVWQRTGALAPPLSHLCEKYPERLKRSSFIQVLKKFPFRDGIFSTSIPFLGFPQVPIRLRGKFGTEETLVQLSYEVTTLLGGQALATMFLLLFPRKESHRCSLCRFPGNRGAWPHSFLLILTSVTRLKEGRVWGRKTD